MEILLYKELEEIKFLDDIRHKLQSLSVQNDVRCYQIIADWMMVVACYNQPNDFSVASHIDVKNPNFHFFNHFQIRESIIKYVTSQLQDRNAAFTKIKDAFLDDPKSLNIDNVTSSILTYFETKQIKYFDNTVVKHKLQTENDSIVLSDFVKCLMTEQGNNFSITFDTAKKFYQYGGVRYQALGSPFASWFALQKDTIMAPAISLLETNMNQDFFRLNLNVWDNGNWLVYMPTTKKEFERVVSKINAHCQNSKTGFYLIYPDTPILNPVSKYKKASIVTDKLLWISMNNINVCFNRQVKFVICFISQQTQHCLEIFQ